MEVEEIGQQKPVGMLAQRVRTVDPQNVSGTFPQRDDLTRLELRALLAILTRVNDDDPKSFRIDMHAHLLTNSHEVGHRVCRVWLHRASDIETTKTETAGSTPRGIQCADKIAKRLSGFVRRREPHEQAALTGERDQPHAPLGSCRHNASGSEARIDKHAAQCCALSGIGIAYNYQHALEGGQSTDWSVQFLVSVLF